MNEYRELTAFALCQPYPSQIKTMPETPIPVPPSAALTERVSQLLVNIMDAVARRDFGGRTRQATMDEFADALADFKRTVEAEAFENAAAKYVPLTAHRNVVKWAVVNGGMTVQCDDNTFWLRLTNDGPWTQIENIPGTVPE